MKVRGGHSLTERLLVLAFVCAVALASIPQFAAADTTTILPGDVHVAYKTGVSAGTSLKWEWQSTSTVMFSVSGASDPAKVLQKKEGVSDSGELLIPKDDSYILTWYNPNNDTVDLTFTVSVAPNAGSIILVIFLLAVFAAVIALVVMYVRRKSVRAHSEQRGVPPSIPPPVPQSYAATTPPSPPPVPPPGFEVKPVRRGMGFCPNCGTSVTREAVFCANCGWRLLPR